MRHAAVTVLIVVATALGFVAVPAGAHATSEDRARAAPRCQRTLATYPVLRPGDQGRAVRTLQCTLRDAGFGPVPVNGTYGPRTRAAVRRVEASFEGTAPKPGRINNGFWVLLFARQLPARDLQLGGSGRVVKALQRALRAAGGDVTVDGDFGLQTRRVVRRYQRALGVTVTGVVDGDTRFFLKMGGVIGQQN